MDFIVWAYKHTLPFGSKCGTQRSELTFKTIDYWVKRAFGKSARTTSLSVAPDRLVLVHGVAWHPQVNPAAAGTTCPTGHKV